MLQRRRAQHECGRLRTTLRTFLPFVSCETGGWIYSRPRLKAAARGGDCRKLGAGRVGLGKSAKSDVCIAGCAFPTRSDARPGALHQGLAGAKRPSSGGAAITRKCGCAKGFASDSTKTSYFPRKPRARQASVSRDGMLFSCSKGGLLPKRTTFVITDRLPGPPASRFLPPRPPVEKSRRFARARAVAVACSGGGRAGRRTRPRGGTGPKPRGPNRRGARPGAPAPALENRIHSNCGQDLWPADLGNSCIFERAGQAVTFLGDGRRKEEQEGEAA